MRLLHVFYDDRHAKTFSSYLTQQGVENQLEIKKITDWDSPNYGDIECKIWIIDEDRVDFSKKCLDAYLENPNENKFIHLRPLSTAIIPKTIPDLLAANKPPPPSPFTKRQIPPPPPKGKQPGLTTFILIAICTLILFVSMMSRHPFEPYPSSLPPTALFSSPIEKEFYFDYPQAYEIVDKLEAAYGFEKLIKPSLLPIEGQHLLQQFYQTPYWKGGYDIIVAYFKNPSKGLSINEPLFEKLRQGEIWRLITPCFLHGDIFHLFFNMIWLLVIGVQIERRLGILRYLLFILIAGIFSDTAQYMMSGPNFIGFSGVLCAMIVFVWMRQRKAPWEGYQLTPSSMNFIAIFILVLVAAQTVSFILEITGHQGFSIPIANTAHLSGALAGYLLAKISFFTRKISTVRK